MKACKCDVCGTFYDITKNTPKYRIEKRGDSRLYYLDLCESCTEKLQKFVEEVPDNETTNETDNTNSSISS